MRMLARFAIVMSVVGGAAVEAVPAGAEDLPPGGTFFDDDGDVHEGAIEAVAAAGITHGCGVVDLFCPDEPVTRGQMAAFLVRALDLSAAGSQPFVDVGDSVFAREIEAVAAAGITRGCDETSFCPERAVTRGEMAAFLVRAMDLPGSNQGDFVDTTDSVFADDVAALAQAGVTHGCNPPTNDRFCPDDPVSRAQMASLLARALHLDPRLPPERPALTVAFTGDVLVHSQLWRRAADYGTPFDFSPMFDPVAGSIGRADLAICHLEVPLSEDNNDLSGYPLFNAPRQVADAIAGAGYDGCSTASNHSFDQGEMGIRSTLAVLQQAGLHQSGMAVDATGPVPAIYETDDAVVAHLSATWWLNGLRLPADKPWLVQMLVVEELLGRARSARESGADVVVVSVHCCVEYRILPTSYQEDVVRRLLASPDIDLVVGHHAHVVQPIELIDGEYAIYGLGNFLSGQRRRPETQDGVIVEVEFALRSDAWKVRRIEATPTWVQAGSYRILSAADHNPASWRRTERGLTLFDAPDLVIRR